MKYQGVCHLCVHVCQVGRVRGGRGNAARKTWLVEGIGGGRGNGAVNHMLVAQAALGNAARL